MFIEIQFSYEGPDPLLAQPPGPLLAQPPGPLLAQPPGQTIAEAEETVQLHKKRKS